MKKTDYSKLIEKVHNYGVNSFFRESGIGGNMSFIYRLMHGGEISMKSLDRCCEFFNCNINELMEVIDE